MSAGGATAGAEGDLTAIHRLKAVPTPRPMLFLDTSPRLKVGKLFLPKRVSGGGKNT